jgi:hypothetical protein
MLIVLASSLIWAGVNRRRSYGRAKGSSFSRLRFLQARASSVNPGICLRCMFTKRV